MLKKTIFAVIATVFLVGCGTNVQNIKKVESYKSVNQYNTLQLIQGKHNRSVSKQLLEKFEDSLFEKLYNEKNNANFIPGDQLKLKYEIVNIMQMQKNLADFGTLFGKDNSQFEVLFTILDANNREIGMYHVNIDVEYWLFPTDELITKSAFDTASYSVSQHLKVNYLK